MRRICVKRHRGMLFVAATWLRKFKLLPATSLIRRQNSNRNIGHIGTSVLQSNAHCPTERRIKRTNLRCLSFGKSSSNVLLSQNKTSPVMASYEGNGLLLRRYQMWIPLFPALPTPSNPPMPGFPAYHGLKVDLFLSGSKTLPVN